MRGFCHQKEKGGLPRPSLLLIAGPSGPRDPLKPACVAKLPGLQARLEPPQRWRHVAIQFAGSLDHHQGQARLTRASDGFQLASLLSPFPVRHELDYLTHSEILFPAPRGGGGYLLPPLKPLNDTPARGSTYCKALSAAAREASFSACWAAW